MPGQRVQQARRGRRVDDDRPRRGRDEAGGDRVVEEAEELVVEARAVEDTDGLGVESELLPGDLRARRRERERVKEREREGGVGKRVELSFVGRGVERE